MSKRIYVFVTYLDPKRIILRVVRVISGPHAAAGRSLQPHDFASTSTEIKHRVTRAIARMRNYSVTVRCVKTHIYIYRYACMLHLRGVILTSRPSSWPPEVFDPCTAIGPGLCGSAVGSAGRRLCPSAGSCNLTNNSQDSTLIRYVFYGLSEKCSFAGIFLSATWEIVWKKNEEDRIIYQLNPDKTMYEALKLTYTFLSNF